MLLAFSISLMAFGVRDVVLRANGGDVPLNSTGGGPAGNVTPIHPASIDVDLGEVHARSRTNFEAKLTNVGPRSARVAGTPGICGRAGCVVIVNPPAAILPGQTVTLHLICAAKSAGPFRLDTAVYLDVGDRAGVSIPISVAGSVIDPEKRR